MEPKRQGKIFFADLFLLIFKYTPSDLKQLEMKMKFIVFLKKFFFIYKTCVGFSTSGY